MSIELADVSLPDFGAPAHRPMITDEEYRGRLRKLREALSHEWIVVYGDREHFANLSYLTGFDPRFEEALLLLSPDGSSYLLAGNEGMSYRPLVCSEVEMVLCQSLSLVGQDRTLSPSLPDLCSDLGIAGSSSIGLIGWKQFDDEESGPTQLFTTVPQFVVSSLFRAAGPDVVVEDVTTVVSDLDGLRAQNSVDQIALYEWAATRTSAAVHRIIAAARPGRSEFEIVSQMGYSGEPLSAHIMFASGGGEIVGLRSPSDRSVGEGDAVTTAVGYWGGLTCRAGMLLRNPDDTFDSIIGRPYFAAICAWYENVRVGARGGDVFDLISTLFADHAFGSTLNPGHVLHLDEWVTTPFVPEGDRPLASGMALQCDIIPGPLPSGRALNCEDGVVLANADLRNRLASAHPSVMERISARRRFMRESLGINVSDDVLPMSNCPAYLTPFWLAASLAYVKT